MYALFAWVFPVCFLSCCWCLGYRLIVYWYITFYGSEVVMYLVQ